MSGREIAFKSFPKRSAFQWFLHWVISHPLGVVLAFGLITLGFAWHLPQLAFRSSIYELVIEDLPEAKQYEAFKQVFGSDEIIRVVIKADNVFELSTFGEVEQLARAAAQIKGVGQVVSLPDIKKTIDLTDKWTSEEFAAVIAPVELFQKNLFSQDLKSTVLTLILDNTAPNEEVIRAVKELMGGAPSGLALYQIGMPLVSQALAELTETDFLRIPPITFLIITLILLGLFRNLTCLAAPLATVSLALAWTFGLMGWSHVPLSMLTMIVPVFLIAVGTAYCLYICSEYVERSRGGLSKQEAVFSTLCSQTLPTVLTVVSTLIGTGSLLINRIIAIQEFALFSCFGLCAILLNALVLFPALLMLLPLPSGTARGLIPLDAVFKPLLEGIIHLSLFHRKTLWKATAAFALFCALGFFRIEVETNPVQYFREDVPVSRHFHDIYKDLSGSFPVHVAMEGKTEEYFSKLDHLRLIARLQEFLETLPGVDKTVSIVDYLKLIHYALNQYDAAYYALPEKDFELDMLINNFKMLLGYEMLARFMSSDFSKTNILLLTHISSSRDFLATRSQILSHVQQDFPSDLRFDVTGLGVVLSASTHLVTMGQLNSLFFSLALIFAIMVLLFLSIKVGFIAMLPNVFPIVVNFGIMGWLGVPLSFATSLVGSIAIGLAMDDTIHYLVRYNNEFKKDLDRDRALRDTIMSVGRSIVFTALTLGLGFSVLAFSHFKPTALFGLMMVITMASAVVGDILLLPSLMLHVELVTAWDLLKLIPTVSGVSPGIAHELIQPLNAIKVGSEFLKITMRSGQKIEEEQLAEVMDEISVQADRAAEIINRLQAFGEKPDPAGRELVDLNDPVRQTAAVVGHQLNLEDIELRLDLDENIPPILAHRNRMVQVVFNLVTNASDAISEKQGGDGEEGVRLISIRTSREGDRVLLSVYDSGVGIPKAFRERIFQPFFTTKGLGKGKGLGLSITREIVRDYGGRIEVHSEEGAGTTFVVTFPAFLP